MRCFAGAGLLLTLFAGHGAAQDVPRTDRFVVASIKPWESGGRGQGRAGPDHYYRVATLSALLQEAFDLPPFLMSLLPDWANERWEVSGKADGSRSREQMRMLLRALLEDRFALRAHHERQELPVYELTLARTDGRGPGLKPATGECDGFVTGGRPIDEAPRDPTGLTTCLQGVLTTGRAILVRLHNYGVQQFANTLRSFVRRAVVDKTGRAGLFDFVFDFSLAGLDTPADVPPLETALRESLGLKLESARGMVDVLVIDSIERPTPN